MLFRSNPSSSAAKPERSNQRASGSGLKEESSNCIGVDLSIHIRDKEKDKKEDSPPCPKKRRWSAPDVIKDAEARADADGDASTSTEVKQPKRPISHSPITTRLEI